MTLTPYLIGSNVIASGSNSLTITPSTGTTAGDAIIIAGGDSGTQVLQDVTDTQGNAYSYVRAASTQQPAAWTWMATGATTALTTSDQITLTFSGSGTALAAYAIGCSGFDSSVSVDISTAGPGTTTAISLGTAALAQPNELAIAVITNGNGGGAPTSITGGWTQQGTALHTGTSNYTSAFTQVTSSTSALSIGATESTAANWNVIIFTLTGPNVQAFVGFNESLCFSIASGSPGSSGATAFHESFSFQIQGTGAANPKIVNTWTFNGLSNYGLSAIPIGNTSGNALVVFAGWNGVAVNPVANVSDDAHNFWSHAATSSVGGDVRCAIWVCPNAQAATNLSVGLSWFAQGFDVIVAEVQNFPLWAQIDFTPVTSFNDSTTSLTLSGSATVQDFAFACFVASPVSTMQKPPGWSQIGSQVTVYGPGGAADPASTALIAMWQTAQGGTGVSATGTMSAGLSAMAGVLVAFKQVVTAPVQPNPNWPGIHVEMALGYQPGDPTQVPAWTDVTPRAINESGQSAIQSSRGRQYESEAPEAGDLTINMRNNDGALTPGNASSPYYPNVLLGTPVRVWGTWNNRAYAIAQGYVERYPQTWPDPQYGIVPMEAVDAIDPLSNSVLPSALGGDILTDQPYGYWPGGDTYLQNQAAGLPLANAARTNQRPMMATDATYLTGSNPQVFNRRYLQTGLQWQTSIVGQVENFLGLPGDSNTGIGMIDDSNGDIAKAQAAITPVPGAFYTAPDLPQPSGGVTAEFWAIVDKSFNDSNHDAELFRIDGAPPNYYYNKDRSVRMAVRAGPDKLDVFFYGPFGSVEQYTYNNVDPADGNAHHYAVSVLRVGSQYEFSVYMDGQPLTPLGGIITPNTMNTPQDWNYLCVGGVPHNDGGVAYGYIYTAGQAVYYGSVLPASRIASHYNAGWLGANGDDTVTRIAKLLTWGGFGLARSAAPPSPSPLMGLADQISGQAAGDAISTVATTDGGMFFCDAAGNATWWPRTFLYNRPVKWTLGDNPGETPYDPAEAYDFDNTFVQNTVQIQRQQNVNANAALVAVADQASQKQYFTRPGTQTTIETTSDEDAFDQAQWTIAQYKQPALRVQQVVLMPSANTAVWPIALGIEQGDIVMLTRRPLGGAVISQKCIVQQVAHDSGPDKWTTTISLIPYAIQSGVLTCDTSGFNVVGSNGVGW